MLTYFHTDTPLETDFRALVEHARRVAIRNAHLRWYDWTRYSSRQQTTMQMGGLLGELELNADGIEPFWPYLWLGQWTHAGKGASMGLGRYTIAGAGLPPIDRESAASLRKPTAGDASVSMPPMKPKAPTSREAVSPLPEAPVGTPPDPHEPSSYPRRILLAVTGLSPQVVTETLYALAVKPAAGQPPYAPTEVHLITTGHGRKQAVNNLLMPSADKSGWFHRLRADYDLPAMRFDEDCIHVMNGADGAPLDDIRAPGDNERAADFITEKLRELTSDDNAAVHVSLAGGRKTMGFYVGYALSLFARPQDRLSHVLISAPYESHPKFYYPTPYDEVIHTHDKPPLSLNTRHAEVSLATIPIVSLRHGLPKGLLAGTATFIATVAAARNALGPTDLLIDVRTRRVRAAGRVFELPPAEFAMLAVFAYRAARGLPPISAPIKDRVDDSWSREYLADLRAACGEGHIPSSAYEALHHGVDGGYFSQHLSRLRRYLEGKLGPAAYPYRVDDGKSRPRRYKLAIPPESIRFGDIEATEATDRKHA